MSECPRGGCGEMMKLKVLHKRENKISTVKSIVRTLEEKKLPLGSACFTVITCIYVVTYPPTYFLVLPNLWC